MSWIVNGKWLGCMLNMPTVKRNRHEPDQHLQTALKTLFCHGQRCVIGTCHLGKGYDILTVWFHQWLFSLRETEQYTRPTCATWMFYFGICFLAFVGLPALMDWTRPWHEILHDWNGRVNEFASLHGIKLRSKRCVQQHSDLAHISSLEKQRWVKRLMQWQPSGHKRGGGPTHFWHTVSTNVCRWKGLQHSALESRTHQPWMEMLPTFV